MLNNNAFKSNSAAGSGTVLAISHLKKSLNTIQLTNNTFIDNTCLQNGGVFSFSSAYIKIQAENNTYRNNAAKASGGVGFATGTDLLFAEENGTYIGMYNTYNS